MIHPRFKIFGILLGVLLISSNFMGCNMSKSATPLSLEEIHSIMSEERPEWIFEADIESATDEKQIYWTKNEEGIPICMIVSSAYGGENQLGLNLFSRAYNDPEYEWEDYLRLASNYMAMSSSMNNLKMNLRNTLLTETLVLMVMASIGRD